MIKVDRFLVDSRLRMCHPNGSQAKRFKVPDRGSVNPTPLGG